MLSVQDIQSITFEKAVFGGYDMKNVNQFLEQVIADYGTLQKENAALKAKMKVLVDKIEEYRSVEDGMRRAMVSAQNIAQETIDNAKLESEKMIHDAKVVAEQKMKEYQNQINSEEQKFEQAKAQTNEFISRLTAFYDEQLRNLTKLSASETLASSLKTEQTVSFELPAEISMNSHDEADIADYSDVEENQYRIPEDIKKFMEAHTASETNQAPKFDIQEVSLSSSQPEKSDSRSFSFGELKFGSDYNPREDK